MSSPDTNPPRTGTPVLSVRGATKRYGAVQALAGADLDVHAGEVVALVGDNGAGKSTLVKVISGAISADSGTVAFDGQPVRITRPQDAQALGITTVFQDLALCENLDVVANLHLGSEVRSRTVLGEIRMERAARDLLTSLDVKIKDVRTPVASLSGGQRQSVAIARALLGDPKMVILDEPTAALGVEQTAQVLGLITRLRERGLAVVLISHNLADVREVSDRVVVLRLGRNAGDVRDGNDHAGGDRGCHHRRRRVREGVVTEMAVTLPGSGTPERGVLDAARDRLRRGDLGSIPVAVGLVLIAIVFSALNGHFLSAENLTNLALQMAATGTIALGHRARAAPRRDRSLGRLGERALRRRHDRAVHAAGLEPGARAARRAGHRRGDRPACTG